MRLNATGLDIGLLRYWQGHQQAILSSQGQLASGMRIMAASQDAAGLSIATKLGAQIRGHQAASRGMQDGLSMLRLADGGMGDVMTNLQRMRELTLQAANGTLTAADRTAIEAELDELSAGIDQIVDGTHFNTMRILGGPQASASLSQATLVGRTPISLNQPSAATKASVLGGFLSLNTSTAKSATSANMLSGAIALDPSQKVDATYAALTAGFVTRNLKTLGPTTAEMLGGLVSLSTNGKQDALAAEMVSAAIALDLSNQQFAEKATMLMDPIRLSTATSTPAEAAVLTTGPITLNSSGKQAILGGKNIDLDNGATTNFGKIVINDGVKDYTINLGQFSNTGKTAQDAAEWMKAIINGDSSLPVTAVMSPNDKKISLVSKASGSNVTLTIKAGTSTNTGFSSGDNAKGNGSDFTDLGSVTINGTQVDLGLKSNLGLTPQTATSEIVSLINSKLTGVVKAEVTGANNDQIKLTSVATGAGSNVTIDSATNDSNSATWDDGVNGFTSGLNAFGKDGVTAWTDLGSVTIDGVTTTFTPIKNDDHTPATAAAHMAALINANAASTVTASVSGTNGDQILLTAKDPGAKGFTVEAFANDSNANNSDDGTNGFKLGTATGKDYSAGSTDFGSLTFSSAATGTVAIDLGAFDNNSGDAQKALQEIVAKIDAKIGNFYNVSESGGRIEVTAKAAGTGGNFSLTTTSSWNGFTNGSASGTDANAGTTDFGSVTINGTTVDLKTFDNNGETAASAALWIVSEINDKMVAENVAVRASYEGGQIKLTSQTAGAAGNFTVAVNPDSNGNGADDGSIGLASGTTTSGQNADYGFTDFGSVTINNTKITFDPFDNNSGNDELAAQKIIEKINAASTGVIASRDGNQISLKAANPGAAGNFSIQAVSSDSNNDASDDGVNGFSGFSGSSATGDEANAGTTDFGSLTFSSAATGTVAIDLGAFDNNSGDAQKALQEIVAKIDAKIGTFYNVSESGGRIEVTAKAAGTGGNFSLTTTSSWNGFTNGSASGTDANAGTTDFGSITINNTVITFDPFDNSLGAAAAAQMVVTEINDAVGSSVQASLSGNQIVLTSQTSGAAGNFTLAVTPDSNGDSTDNGSIGLSTGTTTSGQDGTSGITDFGWITINGTPIELGDFDSATETDASVAAILAGKITAAGAGVTATVSNGRLVLTSDDPTKDVVIQNVTADSNGDTSDDASAGFLTGDADSPGGSAEDAGSKTLSQGIIIQLGADAGQTIELKTPLDAYADTLGVNAVNMDVSTQSAASVTLQRIDAALEQAGTIRASLGASMNRVEHALAVSLNTSQNLSAAESRIMGVDMAQSLLSLTRNQIASQAAQAVLQHMDFGRDQVLRLLA